MPTGCKSEYLRSPLAHAVPSSAHMTLLLPVPARDFEGGAENLGTHEFRHIECVARISGRGRWGGGGRVVVVAAVVVAKLAGFQD